MMILSRPKDWLGVLLLTAALLLPEATGAQEGHYWSQQYGTRAELLGGAVVGSVMDLGSSFYNPAALALMPDPSVLLSGQALEDIKVSVEDSTGEDIGLAERTFGPAPKLFATLIPFGDRILAFSILTRQTFDVHTNAYFPIDVRVPGDTASGLAELLVDHDLSETWIGVTWAGRIREGVGLGVTPYLGAHSSHARFEHLSSAVTPGGDAASLTLVDYYRFSHYRLLFKVGTIWRRGPSTMGLTITTPGIDLPFSDGEAHFNRTLVNVDLDGDGVDDNVVANGVFQDVDSDYDSPLSIAGGASHHFGENTLHVSAEWFDAVGPNLMLEGVEAADSSFGATLERRLTQEFRSITNFGVGYERILRENVTVLGGFTTDLSAMPDEDIPSGQLGNWNIYHFTGGAAMTIGKLDLTGGLTYSFGSNDTYRLFDVVRGNETVGGRGALFSAHYRRLKLIFGLTFAL
jgi:hypothetical protein